MVKIDEIKTLLGISEKSYEVIKIVEEEKNIVVTIKSNNKKISLSSLSFDSPIVVKDDRFEFVFRFCEFNEGISLYCETMNLSALDMSTVYGNLVLTDKCKLIYNKA